MSGEKVGQHGFTAPQKTAYIQRANFCNRVHKFITDDIRVQPYRPVTPWGWRWLENSHHGNISRIQRTKRITIKIASNAKSTNKSGLLNTVTLIV
jgi:hypothetical protein